MVIGGSHAFLIANFGTSLGFEESAHGSVPGPSCRRHVIQWFAEQIANFRVLRITRGGRDVNLDIVAITR